MTRNRIAVMLTVTGLLALPASAPARVVFDGDFESRAGAGSKYPRGFDQWNTSALYEFQGTRSARPTIVTDRVRQGSRAARFSVPEGAKRMELTTNPKIRFAEGRRYYFGGSVYLDPSYPVDAGDDFQILAQWHPDGNTVPPVAIEVSKGTIQLTDHRENRYPLGPAVTGAWMDFVIDIKFSRNRSRGFVRGWRDGVMTVPRVRQQTLRDRFNYFKVGVYRKESITQATTAWHDGWKIGTSYRDVAPRGARPAN